jgi:hypothetical protein
VEWFILSLKVGVCEGCVKGLGGGIRAEREEGIISLTL